MREVKPCECGCGLPSSIATRDWPKFGHIKGQPMRFRRGHYLKLYPITKRRQWPPDGERFWSKVDKTGDCWLWKASRTGNGYGAFRYQGKQLGAHQASWILTNGPVPDGLMVRHSCDNPLCVRVDHLLLGTVKDNSRDAMERERIAKGIRSGRHTHPERTARGERNGGAVLSEVDVRAIRQLASTGHVAIKAMADHYGVTDTAIRFIIKGKTWKCLEETRNG